MTSYYNNNNSLVKYGIKGELISKFYIEYVKQEEFIKFNHNDEYDLLTNKFKYEIKTDSNYIKYKSIFLEFESNNKPSGINTSKSDFYIFVCPNNKEFEIIKIFEIKSINLKKIILELESNKILLIKKSPCKDYNNNIYSNNKGYIIPELFLIKYGLEHSININDFEQLKNLL
jgi:hypothetical protein